MGKTIRYVGMDVHATTISVAVVEGRGLPRSLGTVENRPEAVRRLISKLGEPSTLRVCYEAGPTGYVLYWQLAKLGVHCELRARHRMSKYLLRYGQYPPAGCRAWTLTYWRWVRTLRFEHTAQTQTLLDYIAEVEHQGLRIERLEQAIDEAIADAPPHMKAVIGALPSLRGVAKLTAVTLAVEVGTFRRFERAAQLMSYTGMVPSEHSSGARRQLGAITKAGNNHLRRVLIEAAWHYRHQPRLSKRQRALHKQLDPRIVEVAWNAQLRLHRRYARLSSKNKPAGKVVTAIARELVGFIWAIGHHAEAAERLRKVA